MKTFLRDFFKEFSEMIVDAVKILVFIGFVSVVYAGLLLCWITVACLLFIGGK